MKKQVLIISEKTNYVTELICSIKNLNINATLAVTLREAVHCFIKDDFSIIVVENNIAARDNYHLIRAMKNARTMPIVVLSLQSDCTYRLSALQAGAHVFLNATYSFDEILAQITALMQLYIDLTPKGDTSQILTFGKDLIIDDSTRQVFLKGKELKLTRKEFDVLHCLASNPGRVFTREQLYDRIWDEQSAFNVDDVVKTHIKTLRQKLSDADLEYIKNVWGVGYRFNHNEEK